MDRPSEHPARPKHRPLRRVAVYAASSRALSRPYLDAAAELGRELANAEIEIVSGGGSTGLMGALADAAMDAGGAVHGVVPEFLLELEVSHTGLTQLEVVADMHERKRRMLDGADGVIAMPGGCGTYEEVFEAMTLKRLGRWGGPIVLLNTSGFYDRFLDFLQHSIRERFMSEEHGRLWHVVTHPLEVVDALRHEPSWDATALRLATVAT